MDIASLRRLFTITSGSVYLNNAAQSPLCVPVRRRLDDYLDLAANKPDHRPVERGSVRQLLAKLLGGAPDEYALVTSTGVGIGLVAEGFAFQPGDNVVVPAGEHWNNTFPWLALRERGVEVRLVSVGADERVTPAAVAELLDARTRVLAVASVRHSTGFRADLQALGRLAHARGALFVVDAIQGAGAVPINVEEDGIDVLAGGGFKWLLGMHGTGYLYVRRSAWEKIRPVLPGMYAAEDLPAELRFLPSARRYETGSIAASLFHAWTAGLELVSELGVANIHERILELGNRLISGLQHSGMTVITPVENRNERSAIVTFSAGDPDANQALAARLAERGISISVRAGRCRVSPSFFNTEQEIDLLLACLR